VAQQREEEERARAEEIERERLNAEVTNNIPNIYIY